MLTGTTSGTINLLTGFPEAVFCNSSTVLPLYINCKRTASIRAVSSCTTWQRDQRLSGRGAWLRIRQRVGAAERLNNDQCAPGTYQYPAVGRQPVLLQDHTSRVLLRRESDDLHFVDNRGPDLYPGRDDPLLPLPVRPEQPQRGFGNDRVSWSSAPQPSARRNTTSGSATSTRASGISIANDIVSSTATYTRSVARTDWPRRRPAPTARR